MRRHETVCFGLTTSVLQLFLLSGYRSAMPVPDRSPFAPSWLDSGTLRVMEAARKRVLAQGRDASAADAAAREVALAHYPALPLPLIAEAVAAVIPDPQGFAASDAFPTTTA
jgi:hypothetical protein